MCAGANSCNPRTSRSGGDEGRSMGNNGCDKFAQLNVVAWTEIPSPFIAVVKDMASWTTDRFTSIEHSVSAA